MRQKQSDPKPAGHQRPPPRRIYEESQGKLPEGAACPDCGASYRDGRWTWQAAPADAYSHVCPACERIATDYPAGVVHLEGQFVRDHRDELLQLLQNLEARERKEHPLKRIMGVRDEGQGIAVTVTDAKLAHTFGRALHSAHRGSLDDPPTTSERENLVRVHWRRD